MDLEISQLEQRYGALRRRNVRKERQLVASLAEKGQQLPVVVAGGGSAGSYVLVDGYKRVRALMSLRRDTVRATLWDLGEIEALLLERVMRTGESDSALEQGWLLDELADRFALSHEELARRFDKSQSWISRRIALVRALPREVQQRVQRDLLPAYAAMKYLVPMARAKRSDCVRLVMALGALRPSTREVETLYTAWIRGDTETRELVVTQPSVVLRAHEQARCAETSKKAPGRTLLDDFGILIGTSRRARARIAQRALEYFVPTEEQEAQRAARQARWECDALFRSAAALLNTPPEPPDAGDGSSSVVGSQQSPQESAGAR